MAGPGTHIKRLVTRWLGVQTGGCGGCQALLEEMDQKGPAWVRANMGYIVPKIRANARKSQKWRAKILAHIPGIKAPIYGMVLLAVRNAEIEIEAEKAAKDAAK